MNEQLTPDQRLQALFYQLIMSFQMAVMQQLGMIKNPLTDQIEKDLQQAQLTIDMLDMLKVKSEGNRSKDETEYLEHVLRELKMNYIDELEKSKKQAPVETKTDVDKSNQ